MRSCGFRRTRTQFGRRATRAAPVPAAQPVKTGLAQEHAHSRRGPARWNFAGAPRCRRVPNRSRDRYAGEVSVASEFPFLRSNSRCASRTRGNCYPAPPPRGPVPRAHGLRRPEVCPRARAALRRSKSWRISSRIRIPTARIASRASSPCRASRRTRRPRDKERTRVVRANRTRTRGIRRTPECSSATPSPRGQRTTGKTTTIPTTGTIRVAPAAPSDRRRPSGERFEPGPQVTRRPKCAQRPASLAGHCCAFRSEP